MSDLGNKEIFSINLKYYMNIYNKSRSDVCSDLNIPYSTFTDWSNGNIYPRIDKIELLANYFNIEKSDLIENKNKSDKTKVIIPVLGVIPAGIPIEAIETILDYEEIPESWLKGNKEYFGLKVKGDSMYSEYLDNDTLIIQKQDDCSNGDDCVVMVNGQDSTFKRVYKNDNGITLQPLNSSYQPIFYSNEDIKKLPVKILGVVIELRRKKK